MLNLKFVQMKTQENSNLAFENTSQFRDNFSFVRNQMTSQKVETHGFVVPWQLNLKNEDEVLSHKEFS